MQSETVVWQQVLGVYMRCPSPLVMDALRALWAQTTSEGAMHQLMASIASESSATVLQQTYVMRFFKKEKQWQALQAAAYDALYIEGMRVDALTALGEAAFGIGDQTMIADYGKLVCLFHMQHAISSAQCVALFFQVLAARYAARVDEELCDALRAVLYAYKPELSALLYSHLQAHLHAYTTDVAQERVGEPDRFAGR